MIEYAIIWDKDSCKRYFIGPFESYDAANNWGCDEMLDGRSWSVVEVSQVPNGEIISPNQFLVF